jgi:hypothetical protein
MAENPFWEFPVWENKISPEFLVLSFTPGKLSFKFNLARILEPFILHINSLLTISGLPVKR